MGGRFIVLEGLDGSGKTTQLRYLEQRLRQEKQYCYVTREPSDGPIGAMIRQALSGRIVFDECTMAALFAADRLDHLQNQKNGLYRQRAAGMHILCDRYYLSTFAYQSIGVDLQWAMDLNRHAAEIMRPDCHIFIDISVDAALERIRKNRYDVDIYETRERLLHTRNQYFTAMDRLKKKETIYIFNGEQSAEALHEEIWEKIKDMFA